MCDNKFFIVIMCLIIIIIMILECTCKLVRYSINITVSLIIQYLEASMMTKVEYSLELHLKLLLQVVYSSIWIFTIITIMR